MNIQNILLSASQMIVGEKLYYCLQEPDFLQLKNISGIHEGLQPAIAESILLRDDPALVYLVPADLINDSYEEGAS